MSKKTMDELGEDLCNFCSLEENGRGVKCYGGQPLMCWESKYCEIAYEDYLASDVDGSEDD